jgi:Outer membrane protein beta-barrel domain
MTRWVAASIVACAVLVAVPARADSDSSGNVQFLVGQRYLDDFWKPLDRPAMFGIEVDFAPHASPVHVALSFQGSWERQRVTTPFYGSTGDVKVVIAELSVGFLWVPVKKAIVRPYIGAGLATIGAGIDSDYGFFSGTDTDQSYGFYGNAGIFFKVGDTFNVGLDGRVVRGTKVHFSGVDGKVDYTQLSVLLGFSFGK